MWAIQLIDGKPGILYLREYLLYGRILLFEQEEMVLRFMLCIQEPVQRALQVRLRPIRYSDDPRKDKPRKVSATTIPLLAQTICASIG